MVCSRQLVIVIGWQQKTELFQDEETFDRELSSRTNLYYVMGHSDNT
jgi:hypothetical protein